MEIVDNLDGTLSIFGTIIDHSGPITSAGSPSTTTALAGLSRELAANDWNAGGQPAGPLRGSIEDRNVELLVPAQFSSAGQPMSSASRILAAR